MGEVKTFFAPAERDPKEDLMKGSGDFGNLYSLREVVNAIPMVAAILNDKRQILFCNHTLLSAVGKEGVSAIVGQRLGEAFQCIYSKEMPGGCGTSEHCKFCGAVNAILESQETQAPCTRECCLVTKVNNETVDMNFRITATPFELKDKKYVVLAMEDISDEKRRKALERIFFHDVINIAGGVQGFMDFLKEGHYDHDTKEYIDMATHLSHELIEEIEAQRALIYAENGDLKTHNQRIDPEEFLQSVVTDMTFHQVAIGKKIVLEIASTCDDFESDPVILRRILINMLKNALEATSEGETVKVGCSDSDSSSALRLWVNNNAVMPEEAKMQIFERAFSTKGEDRGIGTYSIKLLTEKYLNGQVAFTSMQGQGTTFFVDIPTQPSDA